MPSSFRYLCLPSGGEDASAAGTWCSRKGCSGDGAALMQGSTRPSQPAMLNHQPQGTSGCPSSISFLRANQEPTGRAGISQQPGYRGDPHRLLHSCSTPWVSMLSIPECHPLPALSQHRSSASTAMLGSLFRTPPGPPVSGPTTACCSVCQSCPPPPPAPWPAPQRPVPELPEKSCTPQC